jgi:hypothetical protein
MKGSASIEGAECQAGSSPRLLGAEELGAAGSQAKGPGHFGPHGGGAGWARFG